MPGAAPTSLNFNNPVFPSVERLTPTAENVFFYLDFFRQHMKWSIWCILSKTRLSKKAFFDKFFRNICSKLLLTDISPPHDLRNMESVFRNFNFWFSWRDMKAFRSGVTGGRKKGNTFHWSVVSVHFGYCTFVSRTFSVLCPRN